ncbi:MAG TPA: hypothetical protein VFV72_13275 [Candidatus Limnocylindrales bacterium]|nr:hypothetical protein [Candidatus Limnocylindrales bacterium]
MRGQVVCLLRLHGLELLPKSGHPREVACVVEAGGGVVQGKVAHLSLDAGAVHRHRASPRREDRDDLTSHGAVESERPELREDRDLPGRGGDPSTPAPGSAGVDVELRHALGVAHAAIGADPPPARALEQAGEEITAAAVVRTTAARLRPPDGLDSCPELVRHGRARPPRRRLQRLAVTPAVSPDPAVVQRVHENHPDPGLGEPGLLREVLGAHVAEGVPLEQANRDRHPLGVDLKRVRRLGQAPEAEASVAAGVVAVVELRGVAVGDALRQAAAVLLRAGCLRDELVPVLRVGGEDPPVAHHQCDPCRVQAVFKELEGAAQVPLPTV